MSTDIGKQLIEFTIVMQVTTDWQVVVSRFPGVWTAEEMTPVVSLGFMEGVSPYSNSICANLRTPRMVLKGKCAKIEPRENKAIHTIMLHNVFPIFGLLRWSGVPSLVA